ncbi:uncharacterized protein LOC129808456 [Phlebotomus papatasi]|uniref:uncharacterized protein LOC129808456 n=1 Tax=Phlebotomus papatasi TaxID=29031 RepID=UPI002484266D|nr:uncharacterized protein LOC129808456 [Phlebotomus papatasi]
MADPQWNQPHQIDILIGGQHYWELVYDQTIHLGSGLPILKRSAFGWLVVGQIAPIPTNSSVTQNCNLTTLESIDATLKKFHEIEDLPSCDRRQEENDLAQKIYSETVSRDSSGRFIVHLPFTDDVENLASNRSTAAKQLYILEQKLNASPNMRAKYEEIFGEYLSLGIIERVPTEELSQKSYYLPYHGVYKESSQTTKLRVVFNGSSKSNNNFSLNDTLLTGPTVQPSLIEIFWRFRLHPYAMTCDITKMYLQFLIAPEHKNYQRFLFRSVKGGIVEEYRFRTLCFGIKSSPFLATRSLVQLAEEDGEQFPAAREVLLISFYVDDCLVSAESVEKLHLIRKELTDLLERAQLQLAKWTSNVQNLSDEVHQEPKEVVPDQPNEGSVSILGLCWSPEVDHLSYKYSPETDNSNPTMRKVFSIASRIYDPLGLIGPFTVNAKQIMQTLWRLKGKWDSPVHDEVIDDRNAFIKSMEYIPNIKIPRWVSDFAQVTRRELHLFTDASSKAYGAVVYLVTEDASGARCSRLLTAKSRVAPLKGATIPKLELCAAELGSILLKAVRNALQCEIYFCWTDATIVLCQIHAPDRRERFAKNRLKIILENTVSERWNHVPTKENPADIISRGVTAEQLMELKLWWNGPDWLQENSKFWPKLPELKTVMISSKTVVTGPGIREYLMKQSNSFSYIRRTLAWVLRFVYNTRAKGNYLAGPLQPEELQNAEVHLVKFEQEEFLRYDIRVLEGDIQKPLSKPLRNLAPFLDENGVIRVGGRLENADLNRETKNPMILPGGPLAKRIVSHEHHRMWHAGPRLIMMGLRRKYHRRRVQINDDDVQVSVKNPLEQCDLSKIKDFVNLEYLEIIITVVLVILIIGVMYHLFRKWRANIHKRATRQVMLRTLGNKSRESLAETAA